MESRSKEQRKGSGSINKPKENKDMRSSDQNERRNSEHREKQFLYKEKRENMDEKIEQRKEKHLASYTFKIEGVSREQKKDG